MEAKGEPLKGAITVISAFIALMSALSSLMLTRTLNRSVLAKNEEMIAQTKISDHWAYYQSKNVPLQIMEAIADLGVGGSSAAAKRKIAIATLAERKKQISDEARSLEAEKENLRTKSRSLSEVAQVFASAVALLQLALMLIPLAYLSSSRRFLVLASTFGLLGTSFFGVGLAHFFAAL